MSKRLFRRNFIKKSIALLSGIFVAGTGTKNLQAQNQSSKKSSKYDEPANDTIKTIKSLRTTHGNFTDQDIPDSKLQIILDSTVRAANSSNMQTYSIVVVKDRGTARRDRPGGSRSPPRRYSRSRPSPTTPSSVPGNAPGRLHPRGRRSGRGRCRPRGGTHGPG